MTDDPRQLNLFAEKPKGPLPDPVSWTARHWPAFVADTSLRPPALSAIELWAESVQELATGPQALLMYIASQTEGSRSCRMAMRHLALSSGMARNTCKRHLEKLLAAGLVMTKVWVEPTGRSARVLGYEFRLITNSNDHAEAIADGCKSSRTLASGDAP